MSETMDSDKSATFLLIKNTKIPTENTFKFGTDKIHLNQLFIIF